MKSLAKLFSVLGVILIVLSILVFSLLLWSDRRAGETTRAVLESLQEQIAENKESGDQHDPPLFRLNPQISMPTAEINGWRYCGIVRVPSIGLTLPVLDEWTGTEHRVSPCRYAGSVYGDNFVLIGQNYRSLFGALKNLNAEDLVEFEDLNGNVFRYSVFAIEPLLKNQLEEMTEGDWDLTLFTCIPGGRTRIAVRCNELT